QNLARSLAASYNNALHEFDALVWPTTPMKAQEIPPPDAPLEVKIRKTIEMITNTCPLNITGHPAVTVPCAMSEGLPVGMMFAGKMADEAMILRIADAFQRNIFATPTPSASKKK
ncbi:MAG: amidase family protein, partial [Candidatus Binataceae bacterium]